MERKIWEMKTSFIVVGLLCYLAIMMVWTSYHDIHELHTPAPNLMPIFSRIHKEIFQNGMYQNKFETFLSVSFLLLTMYVSFNNLTKSF